MYLQPLPRELFGAGDFINCAIAPVSSVAPAIRWPNAFIAAVVEGTQVLRERKNLELVVQQWERAENTKTNKFFWCSEREIGDGGRMIRNDSVGTQGLTGAMTIG